MVLTVKTSKSVFTAARPCLCAKRNSHITPILAALRWLPESFTIDFKAPNGLGPAYNLRSANSLRASSLLKILWQGSTNCF